MDSARITQEQIIESETKLLYAMQNNDVAALDDLLHDQLLFLDPGGQIITKTVEMDTARSGNMVLNELLVGDQLIHLVDDTAIVSVIVVIRGNYIGQAIEGTFRYIRVWKLGEGSCRVIAGSAVQI